MEMESPQTSRRKITEGDTGLPKVNCTPKTRRKSGIVDEFSLYNLHGEASPNFRAGQDVLEVGWGDSPEPLNVEPKFDRNRTPLTCKKKLETKESPKSSVQFKRRNIQPTLNIPSKSIIDVAKYVAEVQELSKTIMKEFNSKHKRDKDPPEDEVIIIGGNRLIETNPKPKSSSPGRNENKKDNNQNKDPMFDSVLQSFINEEDDDWLSQALSSQEQAPKTPHKGGTFVKSKSENELTLPPPPVSVEKAQNCRNINNNNNNSSSSSFRRTGSFDLTGKSERQTNGTRCSLQEIERKRLEAKYRRERREIERRKLEAMKKLEMKKLRVIKT